MPEPTPLGLAYKHEHAIDEDALCDELAGSGYLRAYVGWASDQTDAPRLFHVGSGLLGIATSLGNRVWCHSWGQDIYPNLWMCLLAPSGFYRKSTSIGYTSGLLSDVDRQMLLPRDFSREKLVGQLGQRSDVLLVASEFGELLAKLTRDYMAGTKEMLTGLYDGEGYERETQRESANVKKPAISILTASTEDWISNRVTAGDLRGGFLSRFLFLPARQKAQSRGISEGENQALRDDLLDALRGRTRVQGRIDLRAVKPLLDEWIGRFEEEVNASPDPRMMGFFSRAGLCILKLSMCFQASEWPLSLTVSEEAARKAIKLWEFLAANVREVITEQITTTRAQEWMKNVSEVIRRSGGKADYTYLLRETRMLTRDLDNVLRTMVASGTLREQAQKTKGRPRRIFEFARVSALTSVSSDRLGEELPPELPPWQGSNGRKSEESLGENSPGEGP